jgi:hypothetical protein
MVIPLSNALMSGTVNRIENAVSIHITPVSNQTSSEPSRPALTGFKTPLLACAMLDVPAPASLESMPREKPSRKGALRRNPTSPPRPLLKVKA